MTNTQVVEILDEIALLLEMAGGDPLEISAYANGARVLEGIAEPVGELVVTGRLCTLDGIGATLGKEIGEFVATGRNEYHENLRLRFPEEVLDLLQVPGLGAARVRLLHEQHGISSLERLRSACETGELAVIEGFGVAMQQGVLDAVGQAEERRRLFRVNDAVLAARQMHKWLLGAPEAERIEIAGSLRRRKEVVKNVNIVVSSTWAEAVIDRFASFPEVVTLTARGADSASVLLRNGIPVDLRVCSANSFSFVLAHFTGSRAHNTLLRRRAVERGHSLSERGLFRDNGECVDCADESALYAALGMAYVPPELRENAGEFDTAIIPRLIEPADIRGVVHCHSTWSDGKSTLLELAEAVVGLGYDYLVITDHSSSSVLANGMPPGRILRQHAEIDALNRAFGGFSIVKGAEVDILPDGSLDYDDELLNCFDVVIASIHNAAEMNEEEATRRVVKALENRHTMILGHPTGRMLLSRTGYPLNMDKVVDAAVANSVALEINVNPGRLDLDWRHMRQARDRGAKFVIGPDAHRIRGLNNIPYGVGVARKGWLRSEDVLNCQPLGAFLACLRKR